MNIIKLVSENCNFIFLDFPVDE